MKISLEEFRAMANRNTSNREAPSDCFNLEDDIFSVEDFEETEQISIK